MDELIELCFRGIICLVNGDESRAMNYRDMALDIYEDIEYKDKCICKVEDHVPRTIKKKLYEMVS